MRPAIDNEATLAEVEFDCTIPASAACTKEWISNE